MKTKQILALSLFALLGFTSCSDDENAQSVNESPIEIYAGIGNVETRLNINQRVFNLDDIFRVETSSGESCTYSKAGDYYEYFQPADGSIGLTWTSDKMQLRAVFPSTAEFGKFTIPTDQSTKEKIDKAVYMTADFKEYNKGSKVIIEFEPQVAYVNFNVTFNVEKLEITGYKVYANNEIGGNGENIVSFSPRKFNERVEACVAPTSPGAAVFEIAFKENGKPKVLTYKIPQELKKNCWYTYNMVISDRIKVMDVQIAPWTTNDLGTSDTEEKNLDINPDANRITMYVPGSLTQEDISKALKGGRNLIIYGPFNDDDAKVLKEAIDSGNVQHLSLGFARMVQKNANGIYEDTYKCFSIYGSKLGSFEFPETTRYLEEGMCYMSALGYINIPAAVKEIPRNFAAHCNDLEKVSFYGNNVKTIGPGAFEHSPLHSINIPSSVERLESGCLASTCISVLIIPSSVNYIESGILAYAFRNGMETLNFRPQRENISIAPDMFQDIDADASGKKAALILDDSWFTLPSTDMAYPDVTTNTWMGVTWKSITKRSDYENTWN